MGIKELSSDNNAVRVSSHRSVLFLILINVLLMLIFAFFRLLDSDEGFYLMAVEQVWSGKMLYADFFYPQMPYLPYFLSPLAGHGFLTLFASRLVSVLLSLVSLLLFYKALRYMTDDRKTVTTIVFLYVLCAILLTWNITVKTYPWTNLFLMATFFLTVRFQMTKKLFYAVFIGIFLALACNVRSVFLPFMIIYGLALYFSGERRKLPVLTFLLSALVASSYSVYLAVRVPDHFFFNNIGFHLIRVNWWTTWELIYNKVSTCGKLILEPQVFILLLTAVCALKYPESRKQLFSLKNLFVTPPGLAALTGLLIIVIYIIPNQVLKQYYHQAIPFLLLAVTTGVKEFLNSPVARIARIKKSFLIKLIAVVYILGVSPYIVFFIFGVRHFDCSNTIANMRALTDYLKKESTGDPILAEWPAVTVLSELPGVEGLEFLGFEYMLPFEPERKRHYHLAVDADLVELLESQPPEFLIVKDSPVVALRESVEKGYIHEKAFRRLQVYRRNVKTDTLIYIQDEINMGTEPEPVQADYRKDKPQDR